jgi:hypothetical protein
MEVALLFDDAGSGHDGEHHGLLLSDDADESSSPTWLP